MDTSARVTLGVMAVVLLLVAAVVFVREHKDAGVLSAGQVEQQLPTAIKFQNESGDDVSLNQFAGKVVIINSWASWCPSCGKELQALSALQAEHPDDVVVIAINRAEPKLQMQYYLESLTDVDNVQFLNDANDSFFAHVDGFTIPETIFYDQTGTMVSHQRGVVGSERLEALTEQVLATE